MQIEREWKSENQRKGEREKDFAVHLPWPVHDWHTAITKGLSREQAARGTVDCPPSGPLWDAAATPQISCQLAVAVKPVAERAVILHLCLQLCPLFILFNFLLLASLSLSLSSSNSLLPSSLPLLSLTHSIYLSPLYLTDFLPFLSLSKGNYSEWCIVAKTDSKCCR